MAVFSAAVYTLIEVFNSGLGKSQRSKLQSSTRKTLIE